MMCKCFSKKTFYCFIALLLFLLPIGANAADVLFRCGKTSYGIVVSSNASVTEKTAAAELKDYLQQISGASFMVSSSPGKRNIYVGYEKSFAVYQGIEPFDDDSDGFSIKKINHDLIIYGGRERGTMYGVFRFLQEYLGVQWYTPDYTKIPVRKQFRLGNISLSETPIIENRNTDFFCAKDIPWMAHNFMNTKSRISKNPYGIKTRYSGTHTMGKLLPASEYFKTHPEYFAYRDFHRLEKKGQLCLSNPDVLKIITEGILSEIEKRPDAIIYDVSQLDNKNYCTCNSCVALEQRYGGHSGLMIWFVNQVAREVKKKYPEKYIGTFAYHYTRPAPSNIRPDDNVVIRLCTNRCCFSHPLAEECNEANAAFMKDLKDWSRLTDKIYIWDYIVNYGNYMAPYPNIHVLGPNLKTFADNRVIGVFEEAQSGTLGNAFEELKSWLVGQLMWNPEQDPDKLVSMFVKDYYGKAADGILDYYNLCLSLVDKGTHLTGRTDILKAPYTDEFTKEAYKILEKALARAENDIIRERVRKVMMQPAALECARHPESFYEAGKWPEFKNQLLKYGAYFKVHISPEKFINNYEAKMK